MGHNYVVCASKVVADDLNAYVDGMSVARMTLRCCAYDLLLKLELRFLIESSVKMCYIQ